MNREAPTPRWGSRAWGRSRLGPAFDYWLLLRPRQWPILSCQLAVGVLASPACLAALRAGPTADPGPSPWPVLATAWLAWVVCLNGGTLAFNSAYDRDVEDIAYLRRPPPPPPHLVAFSLGLLVAGALFALLVCPLFGLVTATCVVLSVLYSHPATRWKGIPGVDLAVNMVGYGGGTTLAGLAVGQAACGPAVAQTVTIDGAGWWLIAAFALLFGSFYPLTQIYQLEADRQRGDRTLASALGARPSLGLALVFGGLAAGCFLQTVSLWHRTAGPATLLPPAGVLTAWLVSLVIWWWRAPALQPADHERGMYRALALWALMDVAILVSRYQLLGGAG